MKKLLILTAFLSFAAYSTPAQLTVEQEALQFMKAYEKAVLDRDVAFYEKYMDEQFMSLGPNSATLNKSQCLANARRPVESNNYRVIDTQSKMTKIISSSDLVTIVSNWRVVRQATSAVNAPPQIDSGSTTTVLQKKGEWRLMFEHVAFDASPPDSDLGEIGRTSQSVSKSLVYHNYNDLEPMLAASFTRVDEDGLTAKRTPFLASLREGNLLITGMRTSNTYINRRENTAVETGLMDFKGTLNGESFVKSVEYTRMWVKSDDKWKLKSEYLTKTAQ